MDLALIYLIGCDQQHFGTCLLSLFPVGFCYSACQALPSSTADLQFFSTVLADLQLKFLENF